MNSGAPEGSRVSSSLRMSELRRQDTLLLPQTVDLRVRQHAAVTHEDEPRYAEAAAQPVDLVRHRHRVGGVAGIHPHRDRPAVGIGHKPVDDAGQPEAVAVVAALCQGALLAVV